MMWYQIFKFEIQYRIKRVDTYIFFAFLFLFSIVGVDFVYQGVEIGAVKMNAPLVIAKTMGAITGIFMILASMIMGVSVLRDFEHKIESLIFVTPIEKRDYLAGRFLGSFTILLFIFSGLLFGMMLGEFMPWHDPNNYLDFNIWSYLKSFITITLPILFFGASLFFVTGALSKKLVVVYTQGIFLFVIFMLTKAVSNPSLQAILDPFSLTTLSLITESWSVLQKNTQLIPLQGVMLFNKLFWILLAIAILFFGYQKFNFTIKRRKSSKIKKPQRLNISDQNTPQITLPTYKIQTGILAKWIQLKEFSRFYFMSICKQPSFWAIVICGMIIILINSVSLGTVYGVDSYPATYFIVEELQESSLYFFMIILVFYSGELIWKERAAKLNLIFDSTPISSFIHLLGKYLGLILIYIVLMMALILSGIIFQILNGYYQFEFEVYFYGFFLEILPFLALYTLVAFFVQAMVNHKFIGIMVVLLFFIVNVALGLFGFDHDLYLFGGGPLGKYSDMNGYGHFLKPYLIIKTYWMLFGLILLLIASLITVRGTETQFLIRLKAISNRISKSGLKLGSFMVIAFLLLGSYIFYNTNILNRYWTNDESNQFKVEYEKALKQFENIPQAKIIDVNLRVELYPSERNYSVEGYYILKNTNKVILNEIHIQTLIESHMAIDYLKFEGGAITNSQYLPYNYTIFTLNQGLKPGEEIKMSFKQTFTTNGFEESPSNLNIAANGTFFTNKDFPRLGYYRKYELQDDHERADYGLEKRPNKSSIENPMALLKARSGSNSNGINFEMIIGTENDQTAIAPGRLIKQWNEKNRSYFHYQMNQPMIDFYAIVSGRYELMKERWVSKSDSIKKPVELEIYHHQKHDYNLGRMMASMKASLDYYSTNFGPYQYDHVRIMEFPRYANFAQSFPGTIPFSEAIGFVLDIDDKEDVDMAFYVTAHELAHQWFGMQVEAANVQGQHFILETLSQYAAIMVLKQKYPAEKVQQFLTMQHERYLEGKQRETLKEPVLALVENQDYVYYAKGAIQMYKLQEVLGEDKVNLALKRFLKDWNTLDGKIKKTTKRYATSNDLLGYFRTVTPNDLQEVITALFERVGE